MSSAEKGGIMPRPYKFPAAKAMFEAMRGNLSENMGNPDAMEAEKTARVAAAAMELKKLSPTLFQKLTNGLLTEGRATAIGKHLPNEDAQDQLFHWISKNEKENSPFSDRKVAEMARVTAAIKPKTEKGGMFDDFFASYPIEERADIADHISRTLGGELKSLKDASSTKRAGVLEAEGENRIDTETNRTRAQKAAIHEDEFNKRANASGHPIAVALDHFAERLANEPKSKRPGILREALSKVRGIIDADGGAKEPSVQRASENGGSGIDSAVRDTTGPVAKMSKRMERAEANLRYCRERYAAKAPFQVWFQR